MLLPCSIMRMEEEEEEEGRHCSHLHDTQPHRQPPSWGGTCLYGSLGALWLLVASPTHGQGGHLNRQGPCLESGVDGIKCKMRRSYLLYITVGNWFWQGTCRVRTQVLGEDAFAQSPPPCPPSPVGHSSAQCSPNCPIF